MADYTPRIVNVPLTVSLAAYTAGDSVGNDATDTALVSAQVGQIAVLGLRRQGEGGREGRRQQWRQRGTDQCTSDAQQPTGARTPDAAQSADLTVIVFDILR